jgi:ABC-type sugar transport system ATPase subunit
MSDEPQTDKETTEPPVAFGVRDVSKRYASILAVDDVSVSIHKGESVALLGANGAGKSTLVKILTGAEMPDKGEVIIDDEVVGLHSVRDARIRGVGYVPQELTVAENLTIAENVLAGGWAARGPFVDRRRSREIVREVCERVGLDMPPSTTLGSLNASEQRLVMIARTLVLSPPMLILDEPTAALAVAEEERVLAVLNALREEAVSLVYISHRMEEIVRLCDSLVLMRDGRVVMRDTATEETVRHAVAIGMRGGTTMTSHGGLATENGAGVGAAAPSLSSESAALTPALMCRDVNTPALRGVSLEVAEGEIVGLAGLLGSGRTEILRALAGADHIDSGEICVAGTPVRFGSPTDAIAAGVALLPEDRRNQGGLLDLSIAENLSLPRIPSRRGFLRLSEERRLAEKAVERFGIKCSSTEAPLQSLSGGNQQKVILARWLLAGARVLLLDEPTAGIDVGAKKDLMGLVRQAVDGGCSALMVSSELDELCAYCDRIYIVRRGTIQSEVDGNVTPEELAVLSGETRRVVEA